MANIVVTSTTNSIKVEFNEVVNPEGIEAGVWRKSDIRLKRYSNFVKVIANGDFDVSFDTAYLQIDTIDGVAPTSNADLYTKLSALIA